ncbi:MAG: CDP-diacylglycerol--serine O-phosphatidyltransferase [Gammaproteobacteria bacterium]|jgi:CDP-diacylglycerol--serine O-phosphatidyltransferase
MTTETQTPTKRQPKGISRGIYLLPNAITTCALFAGFYAVVAAMKGLFDVAAMAIFVAMVADTLDGRVARLTKTQSAFGAQYDSLSDMLAFGVAPALVIYNWALSDLGKLGWLAAFFYAATGAMRLARFNTLPSTTPYFLGLPIPAAAAVIAGVVWVGHDFGIHGRQLDILAAVLSVGVGVLMISNFHYESFKKIDFHGRVPFIFLFAVLLILVSIAIDPPKVLFLIFLGYALSGPILYLIHYIRKKRKTHGT